METTCHCSLDRTSSEVSRMWMGMRRHFPFVLVLKPAQGYTAGWRQFHQCLPAGPTGAA